MRLAEKTSLVVGLVFLGAIAVTAVIILLLIRHEFAALEREAIDRHRQSLESILRQSHNGLHGSCKDYAGWDDDYAFLGGGAQAVKDFLEKQIYPDIFLNLDIDLITFLDAQGRLYYSQHRDSQTSRTLPGTPVPADLLPVLQQQAQPAIEAPDRGGVRMLHRLADGVWMLSGQAILTSAGTGPARGTIWMGRRLTNERVQEFAQQLSMPLSLAPLAEVDHPADGSRLVIHHRFDDEQGQPVLSLAMTYDRVIWLQGRRMTTLMVAAMVIIGLIGTWATIALLRMTVVNRLARLQHELAAIARSGNAAGRVHESRHDEISRLANHINTTLHALEHVQVHLDEARQQAEAASTAKSVFLAHLSHEIRSPLNGILGLSRLILKGDGAPRDRERAGMVVACGEHLTHLLNDVLDLAKIDADKLKLAPIPVALPRLLRDAAATFVGSAEEKGLTLTCHLGTSLPTTVVLDPDRVRQVLFNLLSNAVKFTRQGTVMISAERREGNIRFQVTDAGVGITAADQTKLFQPFSQVGLAHREQGTGLGLALCQRLVEAMHGTIGCISQVGQGSTFWFELPLERGEASTAHPLNRNQPMILLGPGWELGAGSSNLKTTWITLDDAEEALARLAKSLPETALLIDLDLPNQDLARLQAAWMAPGWQHPVILLAPETPCRAWLNGLPTLGARLLARPTSTDLILAAIGSALTELRPSETPDLDRSMAGRRVLLVDDSLVNREVATAWLSEFGLEVIQATNGVEAITAWETEHPDLVLMDCRMPVMDGFAATAEIRRREEGSPHQVPIVALTADAVGHADEYRQRGMDAHLGKPIREAELLAILRQYLGGKVDGARPSARLAPSGSQAQPIVLIRLLASLGQAGVQELLNVFREESEELTGRILLATGDGMLAQIDDLAHRLAGIAANLGLRDLERACRTLMEDARAGRQEAVLALRERLGELRASGQAQLDYQWGGLIGRGQGSHGSGTKKADAAATEESRDRQTGASGSIIQPT